MEPYPPWERPSPAPPSSPFWKTSISSPLAPRTRSRRSCGAPIWWGTILRQSSWSRSRARQVPSCPRTITGLAFARFATSTTCFSSPMRFRPAWGGREPYVLWWVEVGGRGLVIAQRGGSQELGYHVAAGLFRRGVLVAGTLL